MTTKTASRKQADDAFGSQDAQHASSSQVRGDQVVTRRRAARHASQPQHLRNEYSNRPILHDLRGAAIARTQFWSNALDVMGQGIVAEPLFLLLARSPDAGAAAYASALDALAMVQLGAESKSQVWIKRASESYHVALQKINVDLARAVRNQEFSDELVATPYVLYLASLFHSIASEEGTLSSVAHLRGLTAILRLPAVRLKPFTLLLLDNCIQPMWIFELCLRQRLPTGLGKNEIQGLTGQRERFPDLTCDLAELPVLLERFDALGPDDDSTRVQLEEDISRLEARVKWWLHSQNWAFQGPAFAEKPAHLLPCFVAELDALSAELFEVGYVWPSLSMAWAYHSAWVALLSTTVLRLHWTTDTKDKPTGFHLTGSKLAANLAKTIIGHIGSAKRSTQSLFLVIPAIPFVTRWYKLVGDDKRVEWCAAVRKYIEDAGITTLSDLRVPAAKVRLND